MQRGDGGDRSLLTGGGAPAGLRLSQPLPEKVVLTFPEEGPREGRGFQAPWAPALGLVRPSGVSSLGWGWDTETCWDTAHPPRPPHSSDWQVGRGAQAAFPGTPSPTLNPPSPGLARPLAKSPHLALSCPSRARPSLTSPWLTPRWVPSDRCGRDQTGLCALASW